VRIERIYDPLECRRDLGFLLQWLGKQFLTRQQEEMLRFGWAEPERLGQTSVPAARDAHPVPAQAACTSYPIFASSATSSRRKPACVDGCVLASPRRRVEGVRAASLKRLPVSVGVLSIHRFESSSYHFSIIR